MNIVPTSSDERTGQALELFSGGHFHVVVTNLSSAPINLWKDWCSWGYFNLSFEARDSTGRSFVISKINRGWDRNFPCPVRIEPGRPWVIEVNFDPAIWQNSPLSSDSPKTVLRLRAVFEIREDERSRAAKVWTGKASSPEAEYTLYRAGGTAKATGSSPVVVIAIQRPWQGIETPESPDFVLYENRLAIRRRFVAAGPDEYVAEVIDEARYAALIKRLSGLAAGAKWARWYEPKPHPSDQPTTRLFARFGDTTVVTAILGRDACTRSPASTGAESGVPGDLCRFIDEIAQLQLSKPNRWVPVAVDVKLLREDGGPGWPKRAWPKGWPAIRSSSAKKEGEAYWIRLDGNYLPDVDAFLKRLGRLGLVVLDGKTWAAAYRVHYPGEDEWQKRFEEGPGRWR